MRFIINPGSGPVADTTEDNATANMAVFRDDLRAAGQDVETFIRRRADDYGDGRYAYDITFTSGRAVQIQMPGLPVEFVRYLGEPGQSIWDFPRLYVNGDSWVWSFALDVCAPDSEE